MHRSASGAFFRARLGVLGMVLALTLAACGQVGTSPSGSTQKANAAAIPSPNSSGGGTSTNDTLALSGMPLASVVAGQSYGFTPTASGAGGSLTFTIANMPGWASFDSGTGQLTGTPALSDVGTYATIQISVTDGQANAALPAFSITVLAPLAISGSPTTQVTAGSSYSFVPTTSAASATTLTFSVQNRPAWASFNPSTGELAGIAQTGTFVNIVISVSDGVQSGALPAFSITVSANTNGNSPPTIAGHPAASVVAGSLYSFTPIASDPGGHALTFSIQNPPSWASFSSASGTLSGTPTAASAGTYGNILISVSNGTQSASLAPFSIRVGAPLTISGSPPTQVTAGKGYSFTPTTNAPSGTALTFSIQNRPVWASFIAGSGMLSGTPAATQTGTNSGIVISVSDGTQSVALAPFSIAVVKGVTISGNPPASVNAGAAYSFTPTASGPSGTTLTFSIQNQPAWASFNAANGALAGSPTAANVGTYTNILISVSNGSSSASLPAFSISVNQVSNGTASLTWTPVTKNTNGTVLADLAGYRVHYGTSANGMTTVVTLANPSLTNYLVTNLSSGTWYFGITAYASNGVESSLSNVGQKTIP
jgi:hypothetical protein